MGGSNWRLVVFGWRGVVEVEGAGGVQFLKVNINCDIPLETIIITVDQKSKTNEI